MYKYANITVRVLEPKSKIWGIPWRFLYYQARSTIVRYGNYGEKIVHTHEYPIIHSDIHTVHLVFDEKILRKARIVTFPSKALAEDMRYMYRSHSDKIMYLPNTSFEYVYREKLSHESLRRKYFPDEDRPVVTFLGRYTWQKGLDDVLKLVVKNKDVRLHVNLRTMEDTVISKPRMIRDNISVTKNVPRKTLRELIVASDYVVVPSRFETFGMVALESQMLGTPVICRLTSYGLMDVCKYGYKFIDNEDLERILYEIKPNPPRAGLSKIAEYMPENVAKKYCQIMEYLF